MAKVWTYAEMQSGAARSSSEFDPSADLYEHPTYGPVKVPQPEDLHTVSDEEHADVFAPWFKAQPGWQPNDFATEDQMYEFRLEHPNPLHLPSPEEMERTRQMRIGARAKGRKSTRLASMAEGSRSASAGARAQLGAAPGGDLLGRTSPQLGARTLLSGIS